MNTVTDRINRIQEWRDATHAGDPAINGRHWHDVNLLLAQLKRTNAIAQAVAALETPFDDLDCHFCGVYRYRTEERETIEVTIDEHEDDCPWRLAVGLFPEVASRSGE